MPAGYRAIAVVHEDFRGSQLHGEFVEVMQSLFQGWMPIELVVAPPAPPRTIGLLDRPQKPRHSRSLGLPCRRGKGTFVLCWRPETRLRAVVTGRPGTIRRP